MSGENPSSGPASARGVVVYPSLHWHVSTTDPLSEGQQRGADKFDLGEEGFGQILPRGVKRGDVVTIEGERGTFKTTFAINFLAQGLLKGESVLLISLADRPQLLGDQKIEKAEKTVSPSATPADRPPLPGDQKEGPPRTRMIARELLASALKKLMQARGNARELRPADLEVGSEPFWREFVSVLGQAGKGPSNQDDWSTLTGKSKGQINAWVNPYRRKPVKDQSQNGQWQDPDPRLIEVNFKSGMLQPEEFVQIVRAILEKLPPPVVVRHGMTRIRRVVLDDVSLIGLSYPFLRRSSTTGDLFLPAFVHLMRNYGVDLVMSGTTGHLPEANEAVQRAVALADAVVSCRYCNVFGNQYVTVRGQGLMVAGEEKGASRAESVLAVVRRYRCSSEDDPGTFELDLKQLEGLVGFESGEIRRPGVLLYLFSQYKYEPLCLYPGTGAREPCSARPDIAKRKQGVHERYNVSLQTLIESAFGRPQTSAVPAATRQAGTPEVSVVSFDSTEAEAVHDSLNLLQSGPIDRTVIYSVDEFCSTEEQRKPEEKPGTANGSGATASKAEPSVGEQPRRAPLTTGAKKDDEGKRRRHIVHWEDSTVVRPYYANVLLLAYRTDTEILGNPKIASGDSADKGCCEWVNEAIHLQPGDELRAPDSWTWVAALARALKDAWLKPLVVPEGSDPDCFKQGPAFWFDRSAPETLSCALMDALIAAGYGDQVLKIREHKVEELWDDERELKRLRGDQDELCKTFIDELKSRTPAHLTDKESRELMALTTLFNKTDSADPHQRRLPKNACVYLCWYSQLRDLIDECPDLAERLNVFALPAGGFTGDWFVGIARGSVSIGLGREVLDTLCSPAEEYKRFARGVGLPTLKEFYPKGKGDPDAPRFFAWPRGEHVGVERLLEIHFHALSREFIPEYRNFRSALATVALQLTPMTGSRRDDKKEDWEKEWMPSIQQNVSRLCRQVQALCNMAKEKEEEEEQAAKQQ
ncbi:MAG: hypothetical protein NTX87_09600 [Planctomycetota bacterium]|nr:hypothetical protein [Planctomycetota bacterium]